MKSINDLQQRLFSLSDLQLSETLSCWDACVKNGHLKHKSDEVWLNRFLANIQSIVRHAKHHGVSSPTLLTDYFHADISRLATAYQRSPVDEDHPLRLIPGFPPWTGGLGFSSDMTYITKEQIEFLFFRLKDLAAADLKKIRGFVKSGNGKTIVEFNIGTDKLKAVAPLTL